MYRKFFVFHIIALIVGISLQCPTGQTFEEPTHEAMSLRSVTPGVAGAATLNSFLQQVLD